MTSFDPWSGAVSLKSPAVAHLFVCRYHFIYCSCFLSGSRGRCSRFNTPSTHWHTTSHKGQRSWLHHPHRLTRRVTVKLRYALPGSRSCWLFLLLINTNWEPSAVHVNDLLPWQPFKICISRWWSAKNPTHQGTEQMFIQLRTKWRAGLWSGRRNDDEDDEQNLNLDFFCSSCLLVQIKAFCFLLNMLVRAWCWWRTAVIRDAGLLLPEPPHQVLVLISPVYPTERWLHCLQESKWENIVHFKTSLC